MKNTWHVQWISSTIAFSVVLFCLYLDGFFGDMASDSGFWIMIGIVIALVSGVSAAFRRRLKATSTSFEPTGLSREKKRPI